ncbi:hypothetical protein [Methylophilus aquaticus]|uniref:Uncharacterized protein n=1 Tax=Methylophilus aquaticus TaxID=1971610 RepID=A0ABT9JPA7_9PROT|nr:hypothetical protein [Methylophilus aquaticus]MDP8566398.1 hypothetical protein [Methylophilus aquaticus]
MKKGVLAFLALMALYAVPVFAHDEHFTGNCTCGCATDSATACIS